MTITQGLIGATEEQVWKPPVGVTPGVAGDATAPFQLGTMAWGVDDTLASVDAGAAAYQFCRVGATGIAAGATAGITDGVTVAAAAGNTWGNKSGFALVTGDYVFLKGTVVLTP